MVYGGPAAAGEMGRRLRAFHRPIRGVDRDGRRYSALEPGAYAWVHATLADAIVRGHARLGRPLDTAQREAFWAQWRAVGRLVGVRERDLPDGWAAFEDYVAGTVATRLERTPAVDDVVAALRAPAPPPLPAPARIAWPLAGVPGAHALRLVTAGMLQPPLRERLGLTWSRGQEMELRALARMLRAATPVMPRAARVTGPSYLRARRAAIARGDAASARP
jgi:uncharacterized protein (DUF2236 family)